MSVFCTVVGWTALAVCVVTFGSIAALLIASAVDWWRGES